MVKKGINLQSVYKIIKPEWQKLKHLETLLKILSPAKIVGGAVRNAIMQLPMTDVDIACKFKPEQVKKIVEEHGFHAIPTGIEHGTVTCVKEQESYEVTTLRADKLTDGRHAKVEFITSWQIDAKRRDFTMNAMFSDFNGQVTDYVGGLNDAKTGCIKFIGAPKDRIREDYLRILRFFRFYANYCKSYEIESLEACLALSSGLKTISRERCTYEFLKILSAKNPWNTIDLMSDEIFLNAGLPKRIPLKIEEIIHRNKQAYKICGIHTSVIGNAAIFDGLGELILPKQMARDVLNLQMLTPMHTLKDYIVWINTCSEQILYDGMIIKGMINEQVLPNIKIWIENRFPLQGRDILKLGVKPGPDVSEYLALGLDIFASEKTPITKESLMQRINNNLCASKL